MHRFELNPSQQNTTGDQSAALVAAAAAIAAAAEGTVAAAQAGPASVAAENSNAQPPGLTWPHNTLIGVPSPIQSAPLTSWTLPTSYDYRPPTVSPAASVSSNGQQADLSSFAGLDWPGRSNSWSQPSPKTVPATTPSQFQHLLGSPNWSQSAPMSAGGIVTPTPIHPTNSSLFGMKLDQFMNAMGNTLDRPGGVGGSSLAGGTVAAAEVSPVFKTPGHLNGGIKQEILGNTPQNGSSMNGTPSSTSINGADTRKPDIERINQNRMAALRIEEKVRAEALKLAASKNHNLSLPTVSIPSVTPVVSCPSSPNTTVTNGDSEALPPPTSLSSSNGAGSASFSRAPGLGPVEPSESGNDSKFVCEVCGFSSPSKFHFNSHMNTHEGRLKKHMFAQHTPAQKTAVGYRDASNMKGGVGSQALAQMKALAEMTNGEHGDAEPGTSNFILENGAITKPKPTRKQREKRFICKHCDHVSSSREERWAHASTHIPPNRQLKCSREGCDFVTGYKHHLDFHLKNHDGVKPFFCTKCTYRCVNKSMLNSHMKSHSDAYLFKCADCGYAAKHSHSLHTHLNKYGHRRLPKEMVENGHTNGHAATSGSDNEEQEKSVVLSGNSPQQNSISSLLTTCPTMSSLDLPSLLLRQPDSLNFDLSQLPGPSSLAICSLCDFRSLDMNEQISHNINHLLRNQAATANLNLSALQLPESSHHGLLPSSEILGPAPLLQPHLAIAPSSTAQDTSEAMEVDGTEPLPRERSQSEDSTRTYTSSEDSNGPTGSRKRKSKATKLDAEITRISQRLQERGPHSPSSEEHNDEIHLSPSNCSSVVSNNSSTTTGHSGELRREMTENGHEEKMEDSQEAPPKAAFEWRFVCQHCEMAFHDRAIYVIHRDYHGYDSPFKCNRCGFQCTDKLSFNVHLMEAKHD
ncbi:hypothetical protein QR680_018786 [Steinernema hermaphroditum]|uniref:C2H2-type domain-containing protein n=1 Tax=Steinernema hermaphroditum TaxID=289476 RepID=A0AA39LR98_9BILA|nr:hypothetical protein QR680_018786 [Steinernema hermaphroditum]